MSARAIIEAPARQDMRRGACPTLFEPMQTGDGLLARLRPKEGITPAQLRGLAEAAGLHGNGILEITARGSLQIRGLTPLSAGRLAGAVSSLGIDPQSGVPVETGPLAGLDAEEIADPTHLAEAIRTAASEAGLAAKLGPKVTVTVDGGGRIGLGALPADIRLAAMRTERGARWLLGLGGTAESAVPLCLLEEDEAVAGALRLLQAIAAKGETARGRDLRSDAESLPRLVLAPSPALRAPSGSSSQQVHRGVNTDFGVGPLSLAGRRWALVAALPFGQIEAAKAAVFAMRAEALGCAELRFAPGRRLVVLGMDEIGLVDLRKSAEESDLIVADADPRMNIVACAGAPACASAHAETKALALALAEFWPSGSAQLHIAGCAKHCAEPASRLPAVTGLPGGTFRLTHPNGPAPATVQRRELSAALRRLAGSAGQGSGA